MLLPLPKIYPFINNEQLADIIRKGKMIIKAQNPPKCSLSGTLQKLDKFHIRSILMPPSGFSQFLFHDHLAHNSLSRHYAIQKLASDLARNLLSIIQEFDRHLSLNKRAQTNSVSHFQCMLAIGRRALHNILLHLKPCHAKF